MKLNRLAMLIATSLFVFSAPAFSDAVATKTVAPAADSKAVSAAPAGATSTTKAAVVADVPGAPKSMSEKVSYTLGFDLGQSSKAQDMQIDASFVEKGIVDGQQGKQIMTDEEMRQTMNDFKEQVMQKAMAEQKKLIETNTKESDAYLAKISKDAGVKEIEKGLYYKVLTEGKGPKPTESDLVEVHYEGTLPNGTKFDSSYDRKKPISFPLSQVIPGWTKALVNMPVGSTWMIYIAPELAYGEFAPPSIGPNRALTFKVELLSIKKPEQVEHQDESDED